MVTDDAVVTVGRKAALSIGNCLFDDPAGIRLPVRPARAHSKLTHYRASRPAFILRVTGEDLVFPASAVGVVNQQAGIVGVLPDQKLGAWIIAVYSTNRRSSKSISSAIARVL